MFKAIKEFFFGKPVEAPKTEEVPYKVETPVAAADVAPQPEVQPVVENKVDAVSVALDLEPVDLAAQPAEPAKKPRKPRAPKAEKAPKAPKEKKEAKPKATKKPAAMKAKKAK